jgi:AraC-like DNA-binding protein
MSKMIFSAEDLPSNLDDRARFARWVDTYCAIYGDADIARRVDVPFSARTEFIQLGTCALVEFKGTINRIALNARHIAAHRGVEPYVGLVLPRARMAISQQGRTLDLPPGGVTIVVNTESCEVQAESTSNSENSWLGVAVPIAQLSALVPGIEDRVAMPLDIESAAVRHLIRYLAIVSDLDGIENDSVLLRHVDTTLIDLVAIALGAGGEALDLAGMRGLRAARAREIIAMIAACFADPAFSAQEVCRKLGLSPRYMQELLQQTGMTFSERVLEARLQKARAMLLDRRNDRMKISDIALASGFGDVSYFNQRFRARFGCSPTQHRGGNGTAG